MYAGRIASFVVVAALTALAWHEASLFPKHAQPSNVTTTVASALHRPLPTLPSSITLVGSVVDTPTGAANLTFHVGGSVVNQSSDNGSYQVIIGGTAANDAVWVEASAPPLYYESLLGTYGRLVSLAGADGIVTTAELEQLRISPVSTAMSFFIKRQLGGKLPVSDFQIERASRSVAGDDITLAATVLHEFATGGLSLPAGYESGYAFLQDRDAYAAYITANPTLASATLPTYMASIPAIPITPTQLGDHMLMSGPIPFSDPVVAEPGTQLLSKAGVSFALNGSSGGPLGETYTDYAPTFLGSGELQLVPTHAVFYDRFVNQTVPQRNTINSIVFKEIFAGDSSALWVELMAIHTSYPDNPEIAESDATVSSTWSVSDLDRVATLMSPIDAQGFRALPAFCLQGSPVTLTNCEYALYRFGSSGQGQIQDIGPKVDSSMAAAAATTPDLPFGWTANPVQVPFYLKRKGVLQVLDFAASTTYWKLRSPDAATNSLVYMAQATQGTDTYAIVGQTVMINANAPAGFDQVSPVGTWRYATFDGAVTPYAYREYEAPVTDRFVRAADGTEQQTEVRTDQPDDMNYAVKINSGWQLQGGRMYDTRYRANAPSSSGVGFSSCAVAYASGATMCAPLRVRYFRPLAAVGSRLYGIEDLYVKTYADDYTPPYDFTRYSRPTFYEKVTP